jgi:hypothetical protein
MRVRADHDLPFLSISNQRAHIKGRLLESVEKSYFSSLRLFDN